jgi:hypothetical protein
LQVWSCPGVQAGTTHFWAWQAMPAQVGPQSASEVQLGGMPPVQWHAPPPADRKR